MDENSELASYLHDKGLDSEFWLPLLEKLGVKSMAAVKQLEGDMNLFSKLEANARFPGERIALCSLLNIESDERKETAKEKEQHDLKHKARDQLSDDMLLQTMSGGRALRGILVTKRFENQLEDRGCLLKAPEEVFFTEDFQLYENTKCFSSPHEEDFYKSTVDVLGLRVAISESITPYEGTTESNEITQHATYSSAVKHSIMKLASYSFREKDLTLSDNAKDDLKSILKIQEADSADMQKACERFFLTYGSHASKGPLSFGGNMSWTCSSSGFSQKETKPLEKLQKNAVSATGGGFAGNGVSIEMNIDKIKESYQDKCSKDALRNTHLQMQINGGASASTELWKSGLMANNKTWILTDRGNKLIAVWDIIRRNHKKELGEVGEVLRNAWEKMTGLKAEKDLQTMISYDPEEVLDEVGRWKVNNMTPQQIHYYLEYLLEVKAANPGIWTNTYLTNMSLQTFLQSAVESKLPPPYLEPVKSLMQWLVKEDELRQLNVADFPGIEKVLKWLSQFPKPYEEVQDFKSFDKFLKKTLEDAEIAQILSANKSSSEEINAKGILKAIENLRSHHQRKYADILIVILVYQFQSESCEDDVVTITLNEVQELRQCFSEEKEKFNRYVRKKNPLCLQAYLFKLTIRLYCEIEPLKFLKLLKQIKQMMNALKPPLDTELDRCLRGYPVSEFRQSVQSLLTTGTVQQDRHSLKNALKTATKQHVVLPKDQSSVLEKNKTAQALLERLGLCEYYPKRLQLEDALCVRPEPLKLSLNKASPADERQLPFLVLHKIMSYDYWCRSDLMHQSSQSDGDDFSGDHDLHSSNGIHPVDILLALIICSDDFLRQDLLSRLAKCQLSVPFILPDPFTKQLTIPLWAMRSIIKEWKCIENNETLQQTCPIVSYGMPVVSFIRLGKHQKHAASKSKILNDVISESNHNHYFHRDCPGGHHNLILGEGLVDMCWYLPDGKPADIFPNPITFLNLHGDARQYPQQTRLLSQISSMCFVLLTEDNLELDKELDKKTMEILKKFSSSAGGISVLCEKNPTALRKEISNGHYINLSTRNAAQIKYAIQQHIKKKLDHVGEFLCIGTALNKDNIMVHDVREERILVDESSDTYKRGLHLADEIKGIVAWCKTAASCTTEDLNTLPLQGGSLWKAWAAEDKEEHRQIQRGNKTVDEYTAEVQTKKAAIRKEQLKYIKSLTPVMKSFIVSLLKLGGSSNKVLRTYFLQCLKLELNSLSREVMLELQYDYQSTRDDLSKLQAKKNDLQEDEIKTRSDTLKEKLNKLQEDISDSSFGLEHLLREIGQVYEAAKESDDYGVELSRLPKAAAELLIDGWPLEVMDGDAAHVPLQWVTAILQEAVKMLKDPKIFALSVLGLQSTGKSTMLNTVFGLQFNVSAGRCTRGAFMQLLPLDEELRQQTKCSYVLVVDTEGLRAPALDYLKTQKHDNEFATFVIGLANMTLINIYGEVPGDMNDILQTSVHAFLRMNEVKYKPSCQFIHQSAGANLQSEVGRAKFTQKLNKFTIDAAKEEHCEGHFGCFNDVIKFDDQTDVHHFPGLWKGEPPMAPVYPGYSNSAQTVKHHFIQILCERASISSSECGLSLSSLQTKTGDLWASLLKENFVFSFKNTLEITAYNSLETAYSQWDWVFHERMLNWEQKAENEITTADIDTVPALVQQKREDLHRYVSQELHEPLKSKMNAFFNDKQSEILAQWKTKFQTRLDNLAVDLTRHAENHCIALGKSREVISTFQSKITQYVEMITQDVRKHITKIKKEQEKLNKNLEERKFEPEQLTRVVKKELFTPDSLVRYKEENIITEDQACRINAVLQKSGDQPLESRVNDIMVGGILALAQVKKILKKCRQTEEELRNMFHSIWLELINELPIVPGENVDVEYEVQQVLRHLLPGYEGKLIAKLNEKPLKEWGKSLEFIPKETIHYKKNNNMLWKAINGSKPDPQQVSLDITSRMFSAARLHLQHMEENRGFNTALVQELLRLVDTKIKEESDTVKDHFTFTPEYKLDVYLIVCGHAVPIFEKMADSFKERNDPRRYLELHYKDILFTRFKNQYYQTEAEEAIANTLCASLEEPIKTQIGKTLGAKMVGQMKSSEQYFSSKMALKVKVLTDLYEMDEFDSYMAYVINVREFLENRIKHYTVKYCDEQISGGSTRLQIKAKEEISRLTGVVENTVNEVNKTDIRVWLSTFCEDVTLQQELGAILEADDLLSDCDAKHEPNLENIKKEIKNGLSELRKKLHISVDKIRCESEMANWSNKPHQLLRKSIGCTEQCPFCAEQCDLLDPQHVANGRKHMTSVHRSSCLGGYRDEHTKIMATEFCPANVASELKFRNAATNKEYHPYKDYQTIYPDWSIPPDLTSQESSYWMWFVAKYKNEIARRFDAKPLLVPDKWHEITWDEMEKQLKTMY